MPVLASPDDDADGDALCELDSVGGFERPGVVLGSMLALAVDDTASGYCFIIRRSQAISSAVSSGRANQSSVLSPPFLAQQVVDLAAAKQVASWPVPDRRANFPLAIDGSGTTVATVFRHPARLVLLDTRTGAVTQQLETCGDADDVFFDTKRRRIYVSCGAGAVDVFQSEASGYRPSARVETSSGARTSLFVPELDRLYVAARAGLLGSDAAILVFRPLP